MTAWWGLCAAAVFVLAVALLVVRSPGASATVYALASVPQAAAVAALAAARGDGLLWLDAAAILAVKGLWAPHLVRRAVPHRGEVYGQQAALSAATLYTIAAGVLLLGLWLGEALAGPDGLPAGLGLAAMLVGFGTAAVRPELWSQAAGLLMGEAGLVTALLVVAGDLPPAGEALALAEVVALAAVLGLVVRAVSRVHGAPDARLLRGLRG